MVSHLEIAALEIFLLVACGLLMPEETKHASRIIARWMCSQVILLWHWSSRWEWYAALFAGAAIVIGFGEYLAGLGLLSLSGLALFSKLMHWPGFARSPNWSIAAKSLGGIGIAGTLTVLVLIMLDIKGNNSWSHIPAVEAKYVDSFRPVTEFVPPQYASPPVPPYASPYRKTPSAVYQSLQEEIAKGKPRQRGPILTSPHFASVRIDIGTGDNNAQHLLIHHDTAQDLTTLPEHIDCAFPFKCYNEQELLTTAVTLRIDEKGWGRMWFMVSNTDTVSIPTPYVAAFVEYPETGVSLFKGWVRSDAVSQRLVEYTPKETVDLLPFSVSAMPYEFAVDVHVENKSVAASKLNFRITGTNLKLHYVRMIVEITQP